MAKSKKTKKSKDKKKPLSYGLKKIGFKGVNEITKGLKDYNTLNYNPTKKLSYRLINEEHPYYPAFGTKEHIESFLLKQKEIKEREILFKTSDPIAIQSALEKKRNSTKDGKLLSFDPVTGELVISSEIPNDGSVVVDQIYKDGFFCNEQKIAA